jgi:hypothetical protein
MSANESRQPRRESSLVIAYEIVPGLYLVLPASTVFHIELELFTPQREQPQQPTPPPSTPGGEDEVSA